MGSRLFVKLLILLVVFCLSFTDCLSQCTRFCCDIHCFDNPTFCLSEYGGCPLQAFGLSVRLIAVDIPSSTYYLRISSGATGKQEHSHDLYRRIWVYDRDTVLGERADLVLAQKIGPDQTCATVFGSCIVPYTYSSGTVVKITEGVRIQRGPGPTYESNFGNSVSITLNAADTAVIDTGMLGSSDCKKQTSMNLGDLMQPSMNRGDPINISNGNVYRNEIDAIISSGKIGAFRFERNYNSFDQIVSSFGYGWHHNFDIRILSGPRLQEADGRRVPFYPCATSGPPGTLKTEFCSPPGISDSLVHVGGLSAQYTLYKRNGTRFNFTTPADPDLDRISKITDRNNNEIIFKYNSNGLLDTIKEPGSRYFKLVYSGIRVTQLKNQAGTTLATYDYHAGADTNYLKRVTYGDSSWAEYSYDSASTPYKLKKVLTSDSTEYFYKYDSKGRAKASFKTGGVDSIGVVYKDTLVSEPGVYKDSLIATVTNKLGNTDRLVTRPNALATDRLLVKGFNSGCSCADEYGYDDHSNLIRTKSQLGVVDNMMYDLNDRLIKRVEDSSSIARTDSFHYHSSFDLIDTIFTKSIVDSSKFRLRVSRFDANGNLIRSLDSGLITATTGYKDSAIYRYNSSGQTIFTDGPRMNTSDSSRFVFDGTTGDLQEAREYVSSESLVTKYISYDAFGNPLTVIGPNSDTTIYQYDERQRVENIKRRKGSSVDSTLYLYNFAGNIKKITLPLGNVINYVYDLAGRLTHIINGAADTTIYTYDLVSNRTSETFRKGAVRKTTYFHFDTRSRLVTIRTGDTTNSALFDSVGFRYDNVGNRFMQISGKGDTTFFRYDALNRLDMVRQKHDGVVDTALYSYDLQDNLKGVVSPSHDTTNYKYSDRGHLIQDSSAASGVTQYTYDPAGNLIRKIPASGNADSVTYTYDALNRQTQVKFGSQNLTFDYDASATNNRKGRLWKETGPDATRKFSYDYAGRVTAESITVANRTYRTLYSWDKNGNLSSMTYPSTRVVNFTYDAADRITKATGVRNSITTTLFDSTFYFPFGPDTVMKLGNGIRVWRYVDRRYYNDSIINAPRVFGRKYKYDHNGNITQLLDVRDNTRNYDTLKFDGVDRLTQALGLNRADTLFFTYHKNGNRATKRIGGQAVTNYNYINNRLRNTTGTEVVNYGYNANGSVTGDTLSGITITYTYDKLNRLVKITAPALSDSFAYDGENRRIRKEVSTTHRIYFYDIFGNLISEYDTTANTWKIDYVWANGEPKVRVEPQEHSPIPIIDGGLDGSGALLDDNGGGGPPPEYHYWYHNDHLGTPYVLTDVNKDSVWAIILDPFGGRISESSFSMKNNLRFPGQYNDGEATIYNNWHRFYKPGIGRYYQVDPLLDLGLMNRWSNTETWLKVRKNLYSYVGNNPVNFMDPLGLYSWGEFMNDWLEVTDVRAAKNYWKNFGGPVGWFMSHLLTYSGLETVQESAETLGDPCKSTGQKAWAGAKIAGVGLSWYLAGTTQITGKIVGQERTSRLIGLRNRFGKHFFTDKEGFFFALDRAKHYLHIGPWRPF